MRFISSIENNIVYIKLHNYKVIVVLFLNKVVSTFPLSKSISKRKLLSPSYKVLGACFKQYKTFISLKHVLI